MKKNTLLSLCLISLAAYGCGAGGGGGSTSSSEATVSTNPGAPALSDEEITSALQTKEWSTELSAEAHGDCFYVAKFLPSERFALSLACRTLENLSYEAVVGKYSVKDGKVLMQFDNSQCFAMGRTALRDATGIDFTTKISLDEGHLSIRSNDRTLTFSERETQNSALSFLTAVRGCYERNPNGEYQWEAYSVKSSDLNGLDSQLDFLIENPNTNLPEAQEPEEEEEPQYPEIDTGTVVGGGSYPQAGNTLRMSNATGRVSGAISLNYGGAGGNLYTRTNSFGDRLDVYIAGSPIGGTGETNVTASAVIELSQSTKDSFNYYCGAQPSVVEFYLNQTTGGTPGAIPESVKVWAQRPNGGWCYGIL